MKTIFYDKSIEETEKLLKTDRAGLTTSEAEKRLAKYGKNLLPKKKKDSIIKIFFKEFLDPMVLLMLFAIVASVVAGEYLDAVVIFGIILVDAVMGAFQENRANNTADALSELVKVEVNVLRDNKVKHLLAEDITLGDVVLLESGDKISADMRVIESHNFTVDESILTGESAQVVKTPEPINNIDLPISEQSNMVFSGTTVVSGRARAIVAEIALSTELGKIADTLNATDKEKSPLTIRIEKLSKQITIMIVVISVIIGALLVAKGLPHTEILVTVIAFALSAMPEGLPLALTMALTIASNRMAKRNVIVRKLKAAESLGSCTVIASDKTGTLTVNQQTAKKILLPNGESYDISGTGFDTSGKVTGGVMAYAEEIAFLGVINNEARREANGFEGDSIDIAFLVLGEKLKVELGKTRVIDIVPYESENKYSAVFYELDGKYYCTVKGSLETVEKFCTSVDFTSGKDFSKVDQQNEDLAKDGYRVIALASGEVEKKDKYTEADIQALNFRGLVGFIDPIRKEAPASIRDCRAAGIKVMMITGDHPLTAFSIARDLKLVKHYNQVTTGDELAQAFDAGEEEFDAFVKEKLVYARVTPIQKLQIVESLKRQGEFVAVTGDGVNDAPALKSANIGVAMGSGTDIARETADMIIADDNFSSIVSGIEEGRVAYANIRKVIFFLISCGISEAAFFCLAILLGMPIPLTAVQLLWLNVVTDGLQDFALSFERAEDDILKQPPRNPKESIFDRSLLAKIIFSALMMTLFSFLAWRIFTEHFGDDLVMARSYSLCFMVFMQNIHAFSARSEKRSVLKIPLGRNPMILICVGLTLILQMVVMEVPALSNLIELNSLPLAHLILLFAAGELILLVVEVYKLLTSMIKEK